MQWEIGHWQRVMGFKNTTGCFSQLLVAFLFIHSCSCSWLAGDHMPLITYWIQLINFFVRAQVKGDIFLRREPAGRRTERLIWSMRYKGKHMFLRTWVGLKGFETLKSTSSARMGRIKVVEKSWRLLFSDFLWSAFICFLLSFWKRWRYSSLR